MTEEEAALRLENSPLKKFQDASQKKSNPFLPQDYKDKLEEKYPERIPFTEEYY